MVTDPQYQVCIQVPTNFLYFNHAQLLVRVKTQVVKQGLIGFLVRVRRLVEPLLGLRLRFFLGLFHRFCFIFDCYAVFGSNAQVNDLSESVKQKLAHLFTHENEVAQSNGDNGAHE